MERYYIKKGKKYIPAGYNIPNLSEGVYFHQKQKSGSRTTSLSWWVGPAPSEPINTNLLIQVMKMDDELSQWFLKIQQEDSEEYKQLKEASGGYIKDVPRIYNISMAELAVAILRQVYERLKDASPSK